MSQIPLNSFEIVVNNIRTHYHKQTESYPTANKKTIFDFVCRQEFELIWKYDIQINQYEKFKSLVSKVIHNKISLPPTIPVETSIEKKKFSIEDEFNQISCDEGSPFFSQWQNNNLNLAD